MIQLKFKLPDTFSCKRKIRTDGNKQLVYKSAEFSEEQQEF